MQKKILSAVGNQVLHNRFSSNVKGLKSIFIGVNERDG
jgi:hypothetical protein